jgi:putative hydrolase of the HAD superfamily
MPIDLICLDADDTLWHNMRHFDAAEQALFGILEPFAASPAARERLEAVGARNLALYGYGVKSFTLSMLETATELAGDALPPSAVRDILAIGRDLLQHPVELLPGVEATLDALGELFTAIEIVSDKTADSFRRLFARHAVASERCAMAGDSIRSDVLPALEAGAWAALVPHDIVWFYERAVPPAQHPRFTHLQTFTDLPAWIDAIA